MKNRLSRYFKKNFRNIYRDKFKLALAVILILGFLLRFLGVYPGYNPYHPDEGKAGYSSATYMFLNRTLELPHYHYPALIPLTQLLFLVFFYIPAIIIKITFSQPVLVFSHIDKLLNLLQDFLAGGSKDIWLLYWSRYLTVFFSTFTILLTYFVGKILFSSRLVGILSAGVLAFNFRAVTNSQLDLPDTYNAFYLMLAFLTILNLKDNPTFKWYILSAIAVGISFSTKLQFFIFLPFVLIHLFISTKKKGFWQKISSIFSYKIFAALLAFVVTVLIINIGPITHLHEFRETMLYQAARYGFQYNNLSLASLSYFVNIVLTPVVVVVSVVGFLVSFMRYRMSAVLLFVLTLTYLYYFFYFTKSWVFPRNFVTLIPFFALFAGVGLYGLRLVIQRFARGHILGQVFFCLIVLGVLFESTSNVLIHNIFYMKPWGLTKMQNCLKTEVPYGSIIASHPWDRHILFSLPGTIEKKNLNFIPFDINFAYNAAELRLEKASFALVGLDILSYANSDWWMTNDKLNIWDKPVEISKNTFGSLSVLELSRDTICSAVKPWQAVDNNYVFTKIPDEINFQGKEIISFDFDKNLDQTRWQKIDGWGGNGKNLIWDFGQGHKKMGSLKIMSGHTAYPVIRWVSPLFQIKSGRSYKVEAWIKTLDKLDKKQRDGFLRLDFYEKEPLNWDERTEGLNTTISERYYGSGWRDIKVAAKAPENARMATVSFQISTPSTDFWFDDLVISESQNEITPPPEQIRGNNFIIDDNVLVPNLGGGF